MCGDWGYLRHPLGVVQRLGTVDILAEVLPRDVLVVAAWVLVPAAVVVLDRLDHVGPDVKAPKVGAAIAFLDLDKAYDRVRTVFLRQSAICADLSHFFGDGAAAEAAAPPATRQRSL